MKKGRKKKREGIQGKKLVISYIHGQKSSYGYKNWIRVIKMLALGESGVEGI